MKDYHSKGIDAITIALTKYIYIMESKKKRLVIYF